jgi:hypothetical protein
MLMANIKRRKELSHISRGRRKMSLGRRSKGTDWLSLVSLGFFFITIGIVFIITPNLTEEIRAFFKDFHLEAYGSIKLPAPTTPHPIIYEAIMNFSYIFGVSQIIVLILRFALRDLSSRKAETGSGIIFWLGMGVFADFANSLSLEPTRWFSLLSGLIIMVGLLIISRIILKELLRMF